jgi:hypothetical protein
MMELLTLVLPVFWAIVATTIGLILYRSSASFFVSEARGQRSTRKLRLAGSVVIAGLAFYSMQQATPTERLKSDQSAELTRLAVDIDQHVLELSACFATTPAGCDAQLARLKALSLRLNQALKR